MRHELEPEWDTSHISIGAGRNGRKKNEFAILKCDGRTHQVLPLTMHGAESILTSGKLRKTVVLIHEFSRKVVLFFCAVSANH